MTQDIHIPPEAVEAARKAFANAGTADDDLDPIEATIRAALAAWPGVKLENLCGWVMDGPDLPYVEEVASIILPLTENTND